MVEDKKVGSPPDVTAVIKFAEGFIFIVEQLILVVGAAKKLEQPAML